MAALPLLPPDQPSALAGPTPSAPADKQTSLCCAPGGARQGRSHHSQHRAPSWHWVGGEEPTGRPPRTDVGFLSSLPRGCRAAQSGALVKAKRHQSARRFLGQGATEEVRGPQSTRGMAQTSHHQHSSNLPTPVADPRGSQQARPLPPQACLNGHVTVRGQSGRGPRSFQFWAASFTPAARSAASASGGPAWWEPGCAPARVARASAAAAMHPAEVSGTEVTSKKGLGLPVYTHRPAHSHWDSWREGSGS